MPVTYAEVDLGAIAHNIRAVQNHIGPDVILIAVLKANAYGHGALMVAQTALQQGVQRLGVARPDEGAYLRANGVRVPILVMNYTSGRDLKTALDHDLLLSVTEDHIAEQLSALAEARGRPALVHVKVDTGMGRFGLLPDEVLPFIERLARLPGLAVEGIYSHFAVSDLADKSYTHQQFATFQQVLAALEAAGHYIPIRHIANSGATLDLPETHLDAVRVGIALYGMPPSSEVAPTVPLHPALSLKSRVARVRTLPAGSSISYGRTYITSRPTPVALVPVGYGDGYHRSLSNRGAVLINGRRAPIVGRVCMDQFVVDVSEAGDVRVDDEVVLLGCQGDASITAEEIATWAETINYEVTTGLLPRVPRLYTGDAHAYE